MNTIKKTLLASIAFFGLAMGQASALPLVDLGGSPDLFADAVPNFSTCDPTDCFIDFFSDDSFIAWDTGADFGIVDILGDGNRASGVATGGFEIFGFDSGATLLGGDLTFFYTESGDNQGFWEFLGTATSGTLLGEFGSDIGIRWNIDGNIDLVAVANDVPEPSTLMLLGLGLLGLGMRRRGVR